MTQDSNKAYPKYQPQASSWKINGHTTKVRKGSTVPQQQRGAGFWRETARAREGTILFVGKQYCRTYRIQESPSRKANSSCTDHQRDHQWEMASEKYLWIEGVFVAESQYSWWCGHVLCLSTIDTSNEYVYEYLRTNTMGKVPSLAV